jgi:MFS family permease
MIMLGDSYCFDNPMAMQKSIVDLFGIDNFRFNLLYTVYSLPNIILPFFGGVLIDRLGPRKAIVIFTSIVIVGQCVCVVGAYYRTFVTMIAGRVVFGMGSESLNTAQNSIMA